MAKIECSRIPTISANVNCEAYGVFVVQTKREKLLCCGLMSRHTVFMLLILFLAFGLVGIIGFAATLLAYVI
ncbi:unnamed protein product [Caenorhabditis nigoni]